MAAKWKVLIVEDEIPVAMMMVAALTYAGFDVATAHTGQKGLGLATTREFDLITLNVDLPDASGFDICRKLKLTPISRMTPVVFVSARSGEQDLQRGLELGAVDYIVMPFEATDFIFRIVSQAKIKTPPVIALTRKETASRLKSWAVV